VHGTEIKLEVEGRR